MGFTVDLEALGAFHKFLARATNQASDIARTMQTGMRIDPVNVGQFMSEVNALHDHAQRRAAQRADVVTNAYRASQYGISDALTWYEETEDAVEAELDAAYRRIPARPTQDGERPALPRTLNGTPGEIFRDSEQVDTEVHKVGADVDELEPKLHEVEWWTNYISSWLSPMEWVRWVLQKAIGVDPVAEVIEAFSGSWTEFARVALVWRDCADAYEAMATNLGAYRYLEHYWTGNAADAASVYFELFKQGVEMEALYYREFLYPLYKEATEQVYDAYHIINTILNFIVDTVVTLGVGAVAKSPQIITKLQEMWDKASTLITGTKATLHGRRLALSDASSSEPISQLEQMILPEGPRGDVHGYRHPGVIY